MIGIDNQHGVLPHLIFVHHIKHFSQIMVTHRQNSRVFMDTVLDLLRSLPQLVIGWPVEDRPLITVTVKLFVVFQTVKWLMRVKRLQLQKPVVLAVIIFDKLQAVVERDRNGQFLFLLHIAPVHPVLSSPQSRPSIKIFGNIKGRQIRFPAVTFLSSRPFKGIILGMIVGSASLPVMPVVADQMGVHTVFLQQFRHGVVIRIQRPPAPVQEVAPPCMDFSSRRHTRHAADIGLVKGYHPFLQALKIRCFRPCTAVTGQHMAIQ